MSNTTRYGISALGLQYKDQAQNDEILIDQETGQIHYKRPDGKIVTSSGGGVGGAVPDGVIGSNDILRTVTTESISNILKEGVEKNPSLSDPVRLSLNNLEGTKKEVISYKVTLTTPKSVNHISNGEVTYRFSDVEKLLLDDESLLVIEPIFDKGVKLTDLLKSGGNYYNYQIKFSFSNYSVNNMNNIEIASTSRSSMTRNNILIYSLDKRKLNDITFNKTDSELILNNVDLVKANSVSSKLTGLNINDLKIHGFLIYLINIDPYRSDRPINEFNNSPDTDNLKLLMRENAYEIFKNDIIEMKSKEIKHIENIQSSQDFINYLSSLGGRDVKNHLIYLYDGMGDLFSRMSTYLSRNNFYNVDMRFYTDGTGYQTSYSTKRNGRYNVYITYDGELKKVYFYLNSSDVSGVTAGEDSLKLNTDNDRPVEFKTNDGRIVTLQEVFQSASEGKRKIADILTGLGIPTDTEADWTSIEKSMKQNVMSKSDNLLDRPYPKGYYKVTETTSLKVGKTASIPINNRRNNNPLMDTFRFIYRNMDRWQWERTNHIYFPPQVFIPIIMGERLFYFSTFKTNFDIEEYYNRDVNENSGKGRKYIHCILEVSVTSNTSNIIWVRSLGESDFGNYKEREEKYKFNNQRNIISNIAKSKDGSSFYLISGNRISKCTLADSGVTVEKVELPSSIINGMNNFYFNNNKNLNEILYLNTINGNENNQKLSLKYIDLNNINRGINTILDKNLYSLLPEKYTRGISERKMIHVGASSYMNGDILILLHNIKIKNSESYGHSYFLVQKIRIRDLSNMELLYSVENKISTSESYGSNFRNYNYMGLTDKYLSVKFTDHAYDAIVKPFIIDLDTGNILDDEKISNLLNRINGVNNSSYSFRTSDDGRMMVLGTDVKSKIAGVSDWNGNHFPIIIYISENGDSYIDFLHVEDEYRSDNSTSYNRGLVTSIEKYKDIYLKSWSYIYNDSWFTMFLNEEVNYNLQLGLNLSFKREIINKR